MKLLAVILFALLRVVEYGVNDPAHTFDPADATEVGKPAVLHNRVKWRIEEREDWMATEFVVIQPWSNRTLCVSGNRIETRWY